MIYVQNYIFWHEARNILYHMLYDEGEWKSAKKESLQLENI